MSKQKSPKITDRKLYGELFEIDEDFIREVDYMTSASRVAEKLAAGEVDSELIAQIHLAACNDREHLKGNYCIEVARLLLKINELENALQGKVSRNTEGKKLKATEALIKSIYINHKTKALSVKRFCQVAGISKNKYYRVINQDVTDAQTKRRLKSIQKQVENEQSYLPST
ncbi:MAG: hypothetical protein ABS882_04060 [Lysinibacillus sp.]